MFSRYCITQTLIYKYFVTGFQRFVHFWSTTRSQIKIIVCPVMGQTPYHAYITDQVFIVFSILKIIIGVWESFGCPSPVQSDLLVTALVQNIHEHYEWVWTEKTAHIEFHTIQYTVYYEGSNVIISISDAGSNANYLSRQVEPNMEYQAGTHFKGGQLKAQNMRYVGILLLLLY